MGFGFVDPTVEDGYEAGGWQILPGLDGIPYRTKNGDIPTIKEDDPSHIRPQVKHEVKVRIFKLDDKEDLVEYEKVLNMCAEALGRVMQQDVQYNEETGEWRVMLTWAIYFYQSPDEVKQDRTKYYH